MSQTAGDSSVCLSRRLFNRRHDRFYLSNFTRLDIPLPSLLFTMEGDETRASQGDSLPVLETIN